MHPAQSQLFADHHSFQHLLNIFEAELGWYEEGQPSRVDLAVILDIFDYLQFYAETYHHPIEEGVYELLVQQEIEEADLINRLKAEHKQLDDITRRARRLFNAVASDSVVPVDALVQAGREFLERHRQHIEKENESVYPLLASRISNEQWDKLANELEEQRGPFLSEAIAEEYHSLYDAIMEAEGDILGANAPS